MCHQVQRGGGGVYGGGGLGLVLALLLTCCVTLDRFLPISGPQSPHLHNEERDLNVPKRPFCHLSSMSPSSCHWAPSPPSLLALNSVALGEGTCLDHYASAEDSLHPEGSQGEEAWGRKGNTPSLGGLLRCHHKDLLCTRHCLGRFTLISHNDPVREVPSLAHLTDRKTGSELLAQFPQLGSGKNG